MRMTKIICVSLLISLFCAGIVIGSRALFLGTQDPAWPIIAVTGSILGLWLLFATRKS